MVKEGSNLPFLVILVNFFWNIAFLSWLLAKESIICGKSNSFNVSSYR